jgi:membrane protein
MLFSYKRIKTTVPILIKKLIEDDIFALSSQLAYSLLLSFFPFLIFLITIVSYSNIKVEYIMNNIKTFVPNEVYGLVNRTIMEVMNKRNGRLLSLSLVLTIWSASSGFNAVIKGLNKAYDEKESRNIIISQIISIVFTLALVTIIILAIFLLVFGEKTGYMVAKWFGLSNAFYLFWHASRYILIIIIMTFVFSLLYIYAPCKKHSLKKVLPGAIFSSIGWVLTSLCFSFYINNFSNYSKLYGSIGAVIILMLWLLISSFIIILGGEINSVLM